MKYVIAALASALMVLAGFSLGGAGHGWVAGAFGCFALSPVVFLVAANGLSRRPSLRGAVGLLIAGLGLCITVAIASWSEGGRYFVGFVQVSGPVGFVVAASAYFGSLAAASLAIVRARQVPRHGT